MARPRRRVPSGTARRSRGPDQRGKGATRRRTKLLFERIKDWRVVAGLTAAMNLFNPFGQAAATVTDLVKGDKVVAVEPRRDHRPGAEDDRLAGPDPLLYVLGALETNTLRRWARNREIDPVGLSRPELMVRILREMHVTSPKTLSDVLATLDDDELRDWGRIVGYAADDLPRSELAAMIEKAPLGPLPPGMTLS